MDKLPNDIKNHFRNFYFNQESVDHFFKWLYGYKEIEKSIGKENYFSLIELDYRLKDNLYIARQIIKKIYESHKPGQLVTDHATAIAEGILNSTIQLHDGCRKLAHLSADWEGYVDSVFIAYADELNRLEDTNFYDDRIIKDVKKLLL